MDEGWKHSNAGLSGGDKFSRFPSFFPLAGRGGCYPAGLPLRGGMTEPAHTVRNSLIDKERSFTLGEDALTWRDDAGEGRLAYADVRDMRLIGYPSLIGEALQCTVRGRRHGKVKIRSAHYRGLGDFEDRTETYAPFVAALAKRVAARAPDARFIAGSTGLRIVWLVLGVLCAIVVGLLVLTLFEGVPAAAPAIMAVAICIAAVPIAIRRVRADGARTFDPEAPPKDLLGGG